METKLEKSIVLDMSKTTPAGKFNFQEAVAEAQIERLIAEEAETTQADPEIAKLKAQTQALLVKQAKAADAGDEELRREIRNEVVTMNMRLVTQVLKKYGYFSGDRFQNGCVGLLKAADTYDVTKDVPFVNYAAYCIEMELRVAFKKQTRAFESKHQGFLDSIDEPMNLGNGDSLDRGEMIEDTLSSADFEGLVEEAGMETIIYDLLLPVIEEYGTRSSGIDMELWRDLELQYFLELAVEDSRLKRITFTEMAKQLGSTPQNLRSRHKKVVELMKVRCELFGFRVGAHGGIYFEDPIDEKVSRARGRKELYKKRGVYSW